MTDLTPPAQPPYYEDELVTLYHADCFEMELPQANVVLTDPPYGVGKAAWDRAFILPPIPRLTTVVGLMPGVWNIGRCPESLDPLLPYRWTLAAHLTNGMTRGAIGYGNWIPLLIYAARSARLHRMDGDVKSFVVGREAKPDHPSPKPLAVMNWFLSRLPGDVVLDPFAGSGTTLVAAKAQGRKAIGIEIEERYCEVAVRRLAQEALAV